MTYKNFENQSTDKDYMANMYFGFSLNAILLLEYANFISNKSFNVKIYPYFE